MCCIGPPLFSSLKVAAAHGSRVCGLADETDLEERIQEMLKIQAPPNTTGVGPMEAARGRRAGDDA